MYNRKQKEQVEQRNYVIRPALKEKFTKNVLFYLIYALESLRYYIQVTRR